MAKKLSKKTRSIADIIGANNREVAKNIDALSSQLSELTNLIIEDRKLKETESKKRSSLDRRIATQDAKQKGINLAYDNELKELSSERRSITSKINSILAEEKKIQAEEKKKSDEEARAYTTQAEKVYASGDFVSGLFLSFLGRNEPTKAEQEEATKKEAAIEREALLGELENQRKDLKEQQKALRSELKSELKSGFASFNKSFAEIKKDETALLRDTVDDVKKESIIPKIIDVNVVSIDNKILEKIAGGTSPQPIALGGITELFKPVASLLTRSLSAISPLIKIITSSGFTSSLLAITGGLAGAAASWALFFKGLNDEQEAYNARREREQKIKEEAAIAESKRRNDIAKLTVETQLSQIEAGGTTVTPEVLRQTAQQYKEEGNADLGMAFEQKAKELQAKEQSKNVEEAKISPTRLFTSLSREGSVQYDLNNLTEDQIKAAYSGGEFLEHDYVYSPKDGKWYKVSDITGITKPIPPKPVEPVLPAPTTPVKVTEPVLPAPTTPVKLTEPVLPIPQTQATQPVKITSNKQKNIDLVTSELKNRGFTDNQIAAVLANIVKESGLIPQEEILDYSKTSNERIRSIFGSRAKSKSDIELEAIKKDPKKMGELMYGESTKIGRSMGNLEPGEGFKYRGRGFIQLTGKSNYLAASKAIFGDNRLAENPDLANDPSIAAKITAWYTDKYGRSMAKKMGVDLSLGSQEDINRVYTSAIAGREIKKGEGGYLGGEVMSKVSTYTKQFSKPNISVTPTPTLAMNTPKTAVDVRGAVEDRRAMEPSNTSPMTNINAPTVNNISNNTLSSVREKPKNTFYPESFMLQRLFGMPG
jgi:predicted chitinase